MASASLLRPMSHNPTIYITGLTPSVTVRDLADKFGSIGRIKTDKRSGEPKIYVYNDKATNTPKGDGTVTFEDPNAATAAIDWFNGTDFMGQKITVQLAEEKEYAPQNRVGGGGRGRSDASHSYYGGDRNGGLSGHDRPENTQDHYELDSRGGYEGGLSRASAPVRSIARQGSQSGEWDCPNCNNMNFAKRTECFKCRTPKPVSAAPPRDNRVSGSSSSGNQDDWTCMACSNVNWARRSSCNRCNAPKPSANPERRTGRGGGYNEREDVYERRESERDNRSNRDSRKFERDFRDDNYGQRNHNQSVGDYGYGTRDYDRSSQYQGSSDHSGSRGSSSNYRQGSGSGYRRDRSRSPRR